MKSIFGNALCHFGSTLERTLKSNKGHSPGHSSPRGPSERPKPPCCSSLVLDMHDLHKPVLDHGGPHPAHVCAAPRAAQTCAFWIWIQFQHPNSNFLYFLLVRVTSVERMPHFAAQFQSLSTSSLNEIWGGAHFKLFLQNEVDRTHDDDTFPLGGHSF